MNTRSIDLSRGALLLALSSAMACGSSAPTTADGPVASDGAEDSLATSKQAGKPSTETGVTATGPTVDVTELDQNNTSACSSNASPCSSAWDATQKVVYSSASSYTPGTTKTVDGFWDNAVATGDTSAGSAYGHVSKVPVSTLLPGVNVPVWVASQNWWGSSGHLDNGESSANSQQASNQVADQVSRGFAGQVIAWDGPGKTEDKAVANIMASAEKTDGAYHFAVRFEKEYLSKDNCGSAGIGVECVNAGIKYIADNYAGSSAYLQRDGHPVLFVFISDATDRDYLSDPKIDTSGMVLVMLEPHGFPGNAPPNAVGEFAWIAPTDVGNVTTTGDGTTYGVCGDSGFSDLDSFFGAASDNKGSFVVSSAYKGFDDSLANWSLKRIIDQECGMTWLEVFNHTGSFGGKPGLLGTLNYVKSGGHVDMVMVDTWDDYEEGTEIETGIDNCMSSFEASLDGTTLSWTTKFGTDPMNDHVTGSEATVNKYTVYASSKGSAKATLVYDAPCTNGTCLHEVDVASLGLKGGPYTFYVQAVGQPSIVNHLAGPTTKTFTAK